MDVSISDRNRLSFDARHSYRAQTKNPCTPGISDPATGNYLYRINQGATLEDIYTITPATISDFRISWTRYFENHLHQPTGKDPASLGFPSYIDANSEFKMLPYITFSSTSVSARNGALRLSRWGTTGTAPTSTTFSSSSNRW